MISLEWLQPKLEIFEDVEDVGARVPRRLSDQHSPVELALDACVAWPAGVDKRVDGNQDEALRVEVPDLDRQLSDRGETKHRWHWHLCRGRERREKTHS